MKVIYVSGKFRGKTTWQIVQNIRAAEVVGMRVARRGYMPLIPHTNTANFNGELSDEFLLEGTLELMRRCDAIVMVPGWEESEGARAELREARRLEMPVYMNASLVPPAGKNEDG